MASTAAEPPAKTGKQSLDSTTRQRLLIALQEELARASGAALQAGMSPEDLSAQLDERIRRLRSQASGTPSDTESGDG